MTWELYEVWAEDEDGRQELVDTTKSLKEANDLAEKTLDENFIITWFNRETEDDYKEKIKIFYKKE
jgi:hypothetical protein